MLVHLRWLDLSFNNITEITGLDALGKLEDLSLFNNRISVIQNLDNNTNLQCLSIGNNQITGGNNWSSVMYLRQFSKLHLVNLEGNPLCKDPEYKHFLLAHLKYLKCVLVAQGHQGSVCRRHASFPSLLPPDTSTIPV